MNNKLFIGFFIGLLLVGTVSATNWYVDNSVASSGNGQSWGTAWKAFSNIAWTSVQSGDTIYISGGSISQTYIDMLSVGASGESGNRIIITKGIDAGHNGEVIFDNSGISGGEGTIYISGQSHIVIDRLTINPGAANGGSMRIRGGSSPGSTKDIIVSNNKITTQVQGAVALNGWNNQNAYNYIQDVLVVNNTLTNSLDTNNQNDVIYAQYYENLTIDGNFINPRNAYMDGQNCDNSPLHIDAIQTNRGKDLTISRNYIKYDISRTCSQTFMLAWNIGNTNIFGNIIESYVDGNDTGVRSFLGYKTGIGEPYNGSETVRFYNNVVIADNMYAISMNGNDYEIKNNIFYNMRDPTHSLFNDFPEILIIPSIPSDPSRINNNVYYNGYTDKVVFVSNFNYPRTRTVAQLQGYGSELNGMFADPLFTDFNNNVYSLQSNSPAIDAGASLGTKFNLAYNKVIRSQGPAWDIGAYEYVLGVVIFHPADVDLSGCISLGEISSYVGLWLNDKINTSLVNDGISTWMLHGC